MTIIWTETAKLSYAEELAFIHKKWEKQEVEKFILLSEEFINLLKSNLIEGKPTEKRNVRISVISKQTTVVYKIDPKKKQIHLTQLALSIT